MRYLSDLEVGTRSSVGDYEIDASEIVEFAEKWDPFPFHTDEAAARASHFGGLTASSCHTYAVSSLIFSRNADRAATAAMLGLELSFPKPVRPGSVLTLCDACIEKRLSRSRPGFGVLKSRTALVDQERDEVFVMTSSYLVACRPGA